MEYAKLPCGIRKVKKKQVKDELDRIKQAEKKKRRLEKALATSAAIRSELEKKKQKKIEEQQRLDEEGAAIAEAVALRVLLDEDSDDSCKIMLNKDDGFEPWSCASKFDLFMRGNEVVFPHPDLSRHSLEEFESVSNAHSSGCTWNDCGNNGWTVSYGPFVRDIRLPHLNEQCGEAEDISVDLIAAQAVSALQIAEDAHVDTFMFN